MCMVKFDGTNNFDMWRCEVMDVLNAQNLKDAAFARETSGNIRERLEQDESDSVSLH